MSGVEQAGLVPRLVAELFVSINCDVRHVYTVSASFCQIYNEQVDDLLRLKNTNLKIKPKGLGTEVEGLTMTRCETAEELLQLLETGRKNIIYAETKMNKSSSRSHAVLQLHVTRRARMLEGQGGGSDLSASLRMGELVKTTQLTGKLSVVDLAGSERVKRSGADEDGRRMKEAININTSLLGLSNVMKALGSGSTHVPYRDSKLTHMLSDALGGNCRTSLIVCASPAAVDASETSGTLDFGSRAMKVAVNASVNSTTVTLDAATLAADLSTAMRLRAEGGVGGQLLRLEDELKERDDALGKLTRQVAEAAAERERERAAAAAAAAKGDAAHRAAAVQLQTQLAEAVRGAAAASERAEAAERRARDAEAAAASRRAEVESLEAALAAKSLADANEVDAALAAAEQARAAEAAAAERARADAETARADAAAAAAEGRKLALRTKEVQAEKDAATAARRGANAEARTLAGALHDADDEALRTANASRARSALLEEAAQLQSALRASAERELASAKAACGRLEEGRERSSVALQAAELARRTEREEMEAQMAELVASRDELEATAEGLHATVGSLQAQLALAEGRAADEATARIEQVRSLKASYDEALARLGVSEAEASALRARCDEVMAALSEAQRAREQEEASLRNALREHEASLNRALADARSKSKALAALLEARRAESERAAGLASRAEGAEARYAESEERVASLETQLADAAAERGRLVQELDALTIARGLAAGEAEAEAARARELEELIATSEAREAEVEAALDTAREEAAAARAEVDAASSERRAAIDELRARLERAAIFGAAAEKRRHEEAQAASAAANEHSALAARTQASWSAALDAQRAALARAQGEARAEELRHLREMLLTGVLCLKHGRRGKPHPRHVRCDVSLRQLEWGASALEKADKALEITDILSVEPGLVTEVAHKAAKAGRTPDGCFLSIITPRRTLDLEFRCTEVRDAWFATLSSWRELVASGELSEGPLKPRSSAGFSSPRPSAAAGAVTPAPLRGKASSGAAAWARRAVGRTSSLRSSAVSMRSSNAGESGAEDSPGLSSVYDSPGAMSDADALGSAVPISIPFESYGNDIIEGPSSSGKRALGRVAASAGRTHWGARTPSKLVPPPAEQQQVAEDSGAATAAQPPSRLSGATPARRNSGGAVSQLTMNLSVD